jgi:tetratricopeptide (TPR) repeat protein
MHPVPLERAGTRASRVASRYELRRELARGGMGVIYLAYDKLAQREIAYKRLAVDHKRGAARLAALFEREYNTLAQLAHPGIVQVYEYGIDAEAPYYTMELLSGQDLFAHPLLPVREACRVVRDVASALALLHTRRLVHRDVSPLNVRLTASGEAKLIDFGALAAFGLARDAVGTPGFIAPECLGDRMLDARTDLYSLGAVAYWALTRKTPVRARSFQELKEAWLEPIRPPSAHVAGISEELDRLVLSLLHADRLARPASASEVMDRLTLIANLPPEQGEQEVAFSYLRHPPLSGRSQELSSIRQVLQQTLDGRGKAVLVQGMTGVGRSALLDQVALEAQLAGATVLRSQGGAHAGAFAVAVSLTRAALAVQPEIANTPSVTDSILPALSGVEEPKSRPQLVRSPVDMANLHTRKLTAIQDCLNGLSHEQPLVIIVDDLQRADAESLAVLASLAQGIEERRLLLVMGVTDGHAPEAGGLAKLSQCATKMQLAVLGRDDVVELVTAIFGGVPNSRRLALWLYTHSGGNPARCMDLLRTLLQRRVVQYVSGTFSLPHDVHIDAVVMDGLDAQLAQLEALSAPARALANLLSIQEAAVSLSELSAFSQMPARDTLLAVEELSHRGIVYSADEHVSFVSIALRKVVESSLSKSVRKELHLRVARALLERSGQLAADGSARAQSNDESTLLAGVHMLHGGDEVEATRLFAGLQGGHTLGVGEIGSTRTPLLEAALEALRKQGRSDEQCLGLLVPLVLSGYFGDYALQVRHLPAALAALSKLCGITLAARLRPFVGAKLSLYLGMSWALLRHLCTPRSRRATSFVGLLRDLLTLAAASTAAALCALEGDKAREILAHLEPFSAFREASAPRVAYEFARAAVDIGTGRNRAGAARHAKLLALLKRGNIRGLDEGSRAVYRLACLYGQAQGELSKGSAQALELADELLCGHPFYASHAESTTMAYYALRGEQDKADFYRERAELAALRGGMSWSAVTVLTVRSAYIYMWSRNAIGLVRTIPEFERLAQIAPNMVLYRDLARAYLAFMRGRSEQAVQLYERVLSHPRHADLPTCWIDHAHYAQVLCARGDLEAARRACQTAIALAPEDGSSDVRHHIAVQQLALIEAQLGDFPAAERRLAECLAQLAQVDSPMLVGSLHRDCAQVALLAKDEAKFAVHLAAMSEQYRKTRNPWLIRQCEQLAQDAKRTEIGVRMQVPAAALDAEAMAALLGVTTSGVVTGESAAGAQPATEAEDEAALRPTTHIELP